MSQENNSLHQKRKAFYTVAGGKVFMEDLQVPTLIDEVTQLTGLPQDFAEQEMDLVLGQFGQGKKDLTLDELRAVLISYLESIDQEISSTFK